MGVSEAITNLGLKVAPKVFAKAAPDVLFILRSVSSGAGGGISDGGGGTIKTAATVTNQSQPIPCAYIPLTRYINDSEGGGVVSTGEYNVQFSASYADGSMIDVNSNDRLKVAARGNQPERTFKIFSINRFSGVYIEANCLIDN